MYILKRLEFSVNKYYIKITITYKEKYMKAEVTKEFSNLVDSIEFKTLVAGFNKIFPESKDFSDWVYSNGATLQGYVLAGSDKHIMRNVVMAVKEILKGHNMQKVYTQIEKDDTASSFFKNWLTEQGITKDDMRQFDKASQRTRNIYSYFVSMLLNFTTMTAGTPEGA
jgi:hypothetical protein